MKPRCKSQYFVARGFEIGMEIIVCKFGDQLLTKFIAKSNIDTFQ